MLWMGLSNVDTRSSAASPSQVMLLEMGPESSEHIERAIQPINLSVHYPAAPAYTLP